VEYDSEYSFRVERGKMVKNVIVENKIKMQPFQFQVFQTVHSETLSTGKAGQRRYLERLRCTLSVRSMRNLKHGLHTIVSY
jgi:hypothetical protein